MAIRFVGSWHSSDPDYWDAWVALADDLEFDDPLHVPDTDLLVGATTVVVGWSVNGTKWSSATIVRDGDRLRVNVPASIRDGTHRWIRVVIGGTTYGPWSVRLY